MKNKKQTTENEINRRIAALYEPLFRFVKKRVHDSVETMWESHETKGFDEFEVWVRIYADLYALMAHSINKKMCSAKVPIISALIPDFCDYCGKVYVTRVRASRKELLDLYHKEIPLKENKIGNKKYCSRSCRAKARYRKLHPEKERQKYCVICGNPIPLGSYLTKETCSPKCKKRRQRKE